MIVLSVIKDLVGPEPGKSLITKDPRRRQVVGRVPSAAAADACRQPAEAGLGQAMAALGRRKAGHDRSGGRNSAPEHSATAQGGLMPATGPSGDAGERLSRTRDHLANERTYLAWLRTAA